MDIKVLALVAGLIWTGLMLILYYAKHGGTWNEPAKEEGGK